MTNNPVLVFDEVAQGRDAAGDALRAELSAAADAREAAQQAYQEANGALSEVVLTALRTKLIPVSTIHTYARVAPSRVYQIRDEAQRKADPSLPKPPRKSRAKGAQ